jgi:predicted metalloprotease with PDZ domain
MGNSASQEEIESVGYRVLGVQPNSPASVAGLVSFFDFIVAANGIPLKVLDQKFVEMIKESEDKPLPLTIYNIKSETTRDVVITPRRNWGGQGMLGVTIRFDSFWRAEESLVRVLEVKDDSPAELAGLEAEKDYLLGTAEKVFKDTDTLYEEVVKFMDSTIEFYVYNTASDEVRVVVVMPTENWPGQGCLGISTSFLKYLDFIAPNPYVFLHFIHQDSPWATGTCTVFLTDVNSQQGVPSVSLHFYLQ